MPRLTYIKQDVSRLYADFSPTVSLQPARDRVYPKAGVFTIKEAGPKRTFRVRPLSVSANRSDVYAAGHKVMEKAGPSVFGFFSRPPIEGQLLRLLWIAHVGGGHVFQHLVQILVRLPTGHRQVVEQPVTAILRIGAGHFAVILGDEVERVLHE